MNKFLGLLLCCVLAGCAAAEPAQPVGIGRDRDEFKRSPCACQVFYQAGKWV